MTCSVCDEEYERCVICHLSIRREDGGLCDAHKYDEQLRKADCRLADDYNAEVVRRLAAEAQIRDLLEEREELLTEIVRLQRGNHPAGRALPEYKAVALREALTERDAEHEGGGGA